LGIYFMLYWCGVYYHKQKKNANRCLKRHWL